MKIKIEDSDRQFISIKKQTWQNIKVKSTQLGYTKYIFFLEDLLDVPLSEIKSLLK